MVTDPRPYSTKERISTLRETVVLRIVDGKTGKTTLCLYHIGQAIYPSRPDKIEGSGGVSSQPGKYSSGGAEADGTRQQRAYLSKRTHFKSNVFL